MEDPDFRTPNAALPRPLPATEGSVEGRSGEQSPVLTLAHCRVAIVGLGLMGGSLALALKGHCRELIGVDSSPEALAYALQHQVIDQASNFESAGAFADLIILATPVRSILAYLEQLTQSGKAGDRQPVILDIGSTKTAIVAAMQNLPPNFQPIGGHPMCGKETGGIQHADAELYRNKTFVLCPLVRTSPQALSLAQSVVQAVGANVLELDAEQHDIFAALISHLPYTVATALMRTAIEQGHDALWQMAASGFRDTTRLAASDLAMMSDILLTNRAAVLKAIAAYKTELDTLTNAIESGDATTLRSVLESAQHKRRELFK